MARDSSAHRHTTVKPRQLLKDEIHVVVRGDDLHDQANSDLLLSLEEGVEMRLRREGIEFDEIEVHRTQEDQHVSS